MLRSAVDRPERNALVQEAASVLVHLRRRGVVVHHAAPHHLAGGGRPAIVVFLEAGLNQHELARQLALQLVNVVDVDFCGQSRGIMYVFTAPKSG